MAKYKTSFTEDALEDLAWFKKNEQNEIRDGIHENLEYEPTVETRNRKKLRPNRTAEWELRIGKFRIFYDVDQAVRIVAVEAVGEKQGNALYFQGEKGEL
ncbi:MAG: addiction module toxin RelE [Chloroflexi bacterium]|nr:addiction module toxin RelE [Chloroflexota bacterium]